jgi:hypothetical protein
MIYETQLMFPARVQPDEEWIPKEQQPYAHPFQYLFQGGNI